MRPSNALRDRDVLGLSGLIHVIWLEGINDIGAGTATDAIIAGYQNVVGRLHAKGIKVYAGTLTSALGISGVDIGNSGPGHDTSRMVLTQVPWDYLHPNHAGYMAMGEAVDIQPFAPSHHH